MQVLTLDEKYTKVRQAALTLIGVPDDDLGSMLQMLQYLNVNAPPGDPDAPEAAKMLVALIETHPSKDVTGT